MQSEETQMLQPTGGNGQHDQADQAQPELPDQAQPELPDEVDLNRHPEQPGKLNKPVPVGKLGGCMSGL